MATEFWRWPESRWQSSEMDLKKAKIIACGIDVGSVSSEAVILADGELFAYGNVRTGSGSSDSAQHALAFALEGTGAGVEDMHSIIGTGYGRVNIPFAHRTLTEIACHARGANYIYGPVRTLLDMGGQDCKTIRCEDSGKVKAFLMNDKCAAGTGRGMEVLAELLQVPIEDLGQRSLQIDREPPTISSICVVFAKTEAAGLLDEGWSVNEVLAAYCSAMADRVVVLLRRLGVEKDFAITGGIAKNIGVVKRIEDQIGLKALSPKFDPQIAGALGAALFSHALSLKSGRNGG
jgi:bzd-type benzoyl-CoA reductase Q subunit